MDVYQQISILVLINIWEDIVQNLFREFYLENPPDITNEHFKFLDRQKFKEEPVKFHQKEVKNNQINRIINIRQNHLLGNDGFISDDITDLFINKINGSLSHTTNENE